jgi:hypothetical protein
MSFAILKNTNMSSIYMITTLSIFIQKIVFMKVMNVEATLLNSKGITRISEDPYLIQYSIFFGSLSTIWIWKYCNFKSIRLKYSVILNGYLIQTSIVHIYLELAIFLVHKDD